MEILRIKNRFKSGQWLVFSDMYIVLHTHLTIYYSTLSRNLVFGTRDASLGPRRVCIPLSAHPLRFLLSNPLLRFLPNVMSYYWRHYSCSPLSVVNRCAGIDGAFVV